MAATQEDRIITSVSAALLCVLASVLATLGALIILASFKHVDSARLILTVVPYMIREPLIDWMIEIKIAAIAGLLIGFAVAFFFLWVFKGHAWWTRPRRLDDQASADGLIKLSAPKDRMQIYAGCYGGQDFFASAEDRALVIGPPGTGKTAFLLNQILRSIKDGHSFAAVDFKPELYRIIAPALMEAGYQVFRVAPACIDETADHWNPLLEVVDETELAELVAALLPISAPGDAPFVGAMRDWLLMACQHAQTWGPLDCSLPGVMRFLESHTDARTLLTEITCSTSAAAASSARRQSAGLNAAKPDPLIAAGLSSLGRTLHYLNFPSVAESLSRSDFSMRDLGKGDRPQALFLELDETKEETLGPLLALMCTSLLKAQISTAGKRRPVTLYLDEVGAFPPIPGLAKKLNTIRSRMMPTWLYFQSIKQLNKQYGHDADALFMTAADVLMIFRPNDVETRDQVARLVGTTVQIKWTDSTGIQGTSSSRTPERINVIEPHQIGELKPGECITLYRGASAKGIATPHYVDFPEFKRKDKK